MAALLVSFPAKSSFDVYLTAVFGYKTFRKMSQIKFNLIAAASENMGIGKNNDLPWKLKKEMAYFSKMTKTTVNPNKQNLVLMGRRTWDSVPEKYKPFGGRINLVLTRQPDILKPKVPDGVLVYGSLDEAIEGIKDDKRIEKVWVIGGSSIYKETLNHPNCHRIYLTEIQKMFDCDTFFPTIGKDFKLLTDHGDESSIVPMEKQVENDIEYYFRIYEKIKS